MVLGDSNSTGVFAFDWIVLLEDLLGSNYVVRNSSCHGDLMYNGWKRLVKMLPFYSPDLALVCLGTNDVIASSFRHMKAFYVVAKRLPFKPCLKEFRHYLERIVCELRLVGTTIYLLTIPPLGEDLFHPINSVVAQYNKTICTIAQKHMCNIIDCNAVLVDILESHDTSRVPFDLFFSKAACAAFKHYVLHRDLQCIAAEYGLLLTTDTIHFTEFSGRLLAFTAQQQILMHTGRSISMGNSLNE